MTDSPGRTYTHGPLPAVKQPFKEKSNQILLRITQHISSDSTLKGERPGKFRDKRQPFPDTSHVGLQSGDGARTSTEQNTMRLILCAV